uniref:Uncharacterized protein n=1 Tax=Ascaris lumbricoides TaxID=6252 RepID=A0A0M3HLF9_ASCLU
MNLKRFSSCFQLFHLSLDQQLSLLKFFSLRCDNFRNFVVCINRLHPQTKTLRSDRRLK